MQIEIGTTVSHYRIVDKIASGGMGDVFLAEDLGLDRKVAIKFLASRFSADDEFRQRFIREAQAAASLHHPNIITIHEVSQYRDTPFFVMEYVEGESLKDLIDKGTIEADSALDMLLQISEGLDDAHRSGVVHRDIKPANVMVDSRGRVRILDFGLARALGDSQLTSAESRAGTVQYMSPEQVRGEDVKAASDLFSLGVMAYQMLTGKLPFTGEYEAAITYAIANVAPEPIAGVCSETPPELAEIVDKLLQKDVTKRYREAGELVADLRPLTHGGSGPAGSRRRLRVIPALVVVLAAVLVVAGWSIFRNPPETASPDKDMLAVLPFENLGPLEDEHFADVMTDAITLHLAKFCDVGVISRRSSMQYKSSGKSLREIGNELGATYLLTGTLHWDRAASDKVRINVSLVKAADDSYLWTESYFPVIEGIFDLQSEIADKVTRALNIAVDESRRPRLADVSTSSLEAYDFYLKGKEYFNRSWEREDIEIAVDMYRNAIELDSNFAAAYAMLSRGYASMYWEYYDRSDSMREMAFDMAHRALQLKENLLEGYLALGYCYYHCDLDYERALEQFNLGLTIEPSADLYNAVAAVQRRQGDLQQSVENFRNAFRLDPRSHLKAFDVGLSYGLMREYRLAEDYLDRSIALAPDYSLAYIYRAWLPVFREGNKAMAEQTLHSAAGRADLTKSKYYWFLLRILDADSTPRLPEITPGTDTIAYYLYCAQAYRLRGDTSRERLFADSARMVLEDKLENQPEDARFHSAMGLAYAGLRMKQPAIEHGTRALQLMPASREAFDAPFLVMNFAEMMMIFTEYDAAIEKLEFLLSIPGLFSAAYFKVDPLWRPLHNHPGFQKLLERSA
ncbi:MAG: protein kinase [Candidatus Zixiibacteriota bacterium]|nr:MAG: protein kinase [candidate division Zixibacteria bacterium]